MPLSTSRRMAFLKQSEIRAMTRECVAAGGINLAQGICDTPVPPEVLRGAEAAMRDGHNIYTRYDGVAELRQAIATLLERRQGLRFDPEGEIVVTSGSTAAMMGACLGLLDPGDEVLLFEPYYGYHVDTLLAVGAVPRAVTLEPPDWRFDAEQLRRSVTESTRAIIVNSPSNPSGKVFSRAELELIADLAVERDLFVFTDEIYEHFLYDGAQHTSPATLERIADRTITIGGFSKTLSITGWRIGFSASRRGWAERLGTVNDLVYICAPAPLQYGVASALGELDDAFYARLAAEHLAKRDRLCATLERVGLTPYVPQGAYYVLADVSRLPGSTSKQRVMALLGQAKVAAVPGEAFFREGGHELARFCFAKTDADLEEACRRLEAWGGG